MDVFRQMKQKASQAFPDVKQVGSRISSRFLESLNLSRSSTIHSSQSSRTSSFAGKYDEYYFKKSKSRTAALRQKNGTFSSLINKFDRLGHNLTPEEMIKRSKSPQHCYSRSPKPYYGREHNPSFTSSSMDFNEKATERQQLSSISSDDSGFGDTLWFEEKRKDSIADVDLGTDQVQLTINHVQKTNSLCISLHRARLTCPEDRRVYATLCFLPDKLQKKKGKPIDVAKAKQWEEDFVFTKLSIGQLEMGSIEIKIYQENGFFKRPLLKYTAVVALKDVDITNFQTSILPLTTITNQPAVTCPVRCS